MTTPPAVAQRRGNVRRLAREGLSQRAIGERLGVSKDTVRRDLAHLAHTPDQHDAPPRAPLRERVAQRNEEAFATMRHLTEAVAQVEAQNLPNLVVSDAVAHNLEAELRQHAAALLRLADGLAEWHPHTT